MQIQESKAVFCGDNKEKQSLVWSTRYLGWPVGHHRLLVMWDLSSHIFWCFLLKVGQLNVPLCLALWVLFFCLPSLYHVIVSFSSYSMTLFSAFQFFESKLENLSKRESFKVSLACSQKIEGQWSLMLPTPCSLICLMICLLNDVMLIIFCFPVYIICTDACKHRAYIFWFKYKAVALSINVSENTASCHHR